jgi:hypothetical protein
MSDPSRDIQDQLDAYLDGQLAGDELAGFEKRLADDAGLRAQVQAQSEIDLSLRRIFAPPSDDRLRPILSVLPDAAADDDDAGRAAVMRRRRRLVLAGPLAVAALLVIGVTAWQFLLPTPPAGPVSGLRTQTFGEVYEQTLANGFKAQHFCENDMEFAVAFYVRLNKGLKAERPESVAWEGVSRAASRIITTRTHYVLVRVDGTPILVFVDRLDQDNDGANQIGPGLHVFRRAMKELVLYEVTPLDSPRVLDLMSEIELPEEWMKIAREQGAW